MSLKRITELKGIKANDIDSNGPYNQGGNGYYNNQNQDQGYNQGGGQGPYDYGSYQNYNNPSYQNYNGQVPQGQGYVAPATTPVAPTHTAQNNVDTHHGGGSLMTIFCVGIPLLACGLFIYFAMKRVFKSIDEADENKGINQPLMQDAPGFSQTMVTNNVQKEGRCLKRKHIMPLVDKSPDGLQWHCDICQYTYAAKPGWLFYSCSKCDQDFCPNCFPRVEKTISMSRVDTLAVQDPISARSGKEERKRSSRPQRNPIAQDAIMPAPAGSAMAAVPIGAQVKMKATKALEAAKANPTVQKGVKKIADQQLKGKATALAANIKNKVTNKSDQFDLPPASEASGIPEAAVYNINETRPGSLASSVQQIQQAPPQTTAQIKQGLASARAQRRAEQKGGMNKQFVPNPNVNQHLPEDQSMTAALMKAKMAQQNQENGSLATPFEEEKQRAPTYSNVYDAQVRAASEYENPYDVSRRGTVAAGQPQVDQYYDQNQQSVQGDNYYGQSRDSVAGGAGYDATFHQTGTNNLGGTPNETFHQQANEWQHYDQNLGYSIYEGQQYDEDDYYQAREGGTVADLSEYLAQMKAVDADAGYQVNDNDKQSFEQDEHHEVQPYMSESVAQDVEDYHGQYNQNSYQQNQESYQDHGNQESYQQNQESYQQDGQYYQNQESYQQYEGQENQQVEGQEGYHDQYDQSRAQGTFADLNNYLQDNQESVQPGDEQHIDDQNDSQAVNRGNTMVDLDAFLNQKQ